MKPKRQPPYSLRLTPATRKLLSQLARKHGIAKVEVVARALRKMADEK